MDKLSHLEALRFAAVLENCVDQLSILGYMMPASCEGRKSHIGIQETKDVTETQKKFNTNYQELMSARQGSGETVTSVSLKSIKHKQQGGETEDLRSTQCLSNRAVKHNARSLQSLRKIQADRQYATDVITVTVEKMLECGTFNSLMEANEKEKAKKNKFHDFLVREKEGKEEIRSLEKQLQDAKKEMELELQNRDSTIAYLKDKLQEIKAKIDVDRCYTKKRTDLQVHQTQKKCSNKDNALDKEMERLQSKTDDEVRVHMETENFLRLQYQKVEEKLDYWVDKYKTDTDAKDKELKDLKALKASNLEMLQSLARECQTFEETIIRDRAEKEAKRKQLEQAALVLRSILKLQAWWKGTMVRRYLGRYQALRKLKKKQRSKQKGKKNSGAKKKR
ncbi:DRC9 protein, partial [Rhinopomastus cyanomelas]|nr:DRC9 protein [Rhinopomastus cyanomelas]